MSNLGWNLTPKERWALCEKIGQLISERKEQVFTCLTQIRDEHLLQPIIDGDQEAILIAKEIIQIRFLPPKPPQTTVAKTTTTTFAEPTQPLSEFEIAINDQRIMLWAIKQIGDPMRALEAFEGVFKAMKK